MNCPQPKRRFLIRIVLLLATGAALAAPRAAAGAGSSVDTTHIRAIDREPAVIGGKKALYEELSYPASCREAQKQGRVIVQFVVTARGTPDRLRVVQGIGGGCDEAALAAIRQLDFMPAIKKGSPVEVRLTLPLFFRLAGTGNRRPAVPPPGCGCEKQAGMKPGLLWNEVTVTAYGGTRNYNIDVPPVTAGFSRNKTFQLNL